MIGITSAVFCVYSNPCVAETCANLSLQPLPSLQPQRTLTYCYEAPEGANSSRSVVYYFHGLGGSADEPFREPVASIVRFIQTRLGPEAPLFVGLSLGPAGVIPIDRAANANSVAGQILTKAFPKIEKGLKFKSPPVHRNLLGGSMGGYNVLALSASTPKSFSSVMALCPALINFDPFAPEEIKAYLERHRPYIRADFVSTALQILKLNFPTPQAWAANDPMRALDEGRYDTLPLFLSVGREDEFGYIEGVAAFAERALQRHVPVVYKPVSGPHCSFDLAALADFYVSRL